VGRNEIGTELAWRNVSWVKYGLASGAYLEKRGFDFGGRVGICHSPCPHLPHGTPEGEQEVTWAGLDESEKSTGMGGVLGLGFSSGSLLGQLLMIWAMCCLAPGALSCPVTHRFSVPSREGLWQTTWLENVWTVYSFPVHSPESSPSFRALLQKAA
jgi:hypothetical protein